jgi:hypothetical protein
MQETQACEQIEGLDSRDSDTQHLQPDQSSSRLTEMLNGFSPMRSSYNNESYIVPSAVPSPLHGAPGLQIMPPVNGSMALNRQPWAGFTLEDGRNILTHFYMCNAHMDVLGRTMYDLISDGKGETAKIITGMHDATVAMLEERFQEVKLDVNSSGQMVRCYC